MALAPAKAKFASGAAHTEGGVTGHKNLPTLQDAMLAETVCGMGFDSKCYGITIVFDWNSTTGSYTQKALYVVDGVIKVASREDAEAEIAAYKEIAGTGGKRA